jgi:flavin-dependent dehydrogenase
MLDAEMARNAADAGAVFRVKTALCDIHGTRIVTRGLHGKEEFRFRILIAADGPRSTVARLLEMERARTYLAGIQAEIPYMMDRNLVTIYPDAAPDFFGYAIPSGEGRARIGLCTGEDAKGRFSHFARKFRGGTIHFVTGTLPLGVMPKTYGKRTLFTGDAAGFAKPTSGGGVYTGVRSARHAAAVAVACCESGAFDDNALSAYERRWKDDIGKMLESGFRFFRLRKQLSADDISRLVRVLDEPDIIDAIVRYGDMDNPGPLIWKLMKKPSVIASLGPLLLPGFLALLQYQPES